MIHIFCLKIYSTLIYYRIITVKLLSTNLLQQTALSFLKSQILCPDYSLTQLLNAQFNLVAHAWFGFEATQHHHQLSV